MIFQFLLLLFTFPQPSSTLPPIELLKKDAVVWSVEQSISGKAREIKEGSVWVFVNGLPRPATVIDGRFEVSVTLSELTNTIVVSSEKGPHGDLSDTLRLSLGYKPIPILKPEVSLSRENIQLHAHILENPLQETPDYQWTASSDNPEAAYFNHQSGMRASITKPTRDGDYWFELAVGSRFGTNIYKTLIRKEGENLIIFGPDNPEHPWMDRAVLYQLSPYNFTGQGGLQAITDKLPEIAGMGINTLYLQPIFESARKGQGYDVVNYFSLNPGYGNEEDLKNLISTSKELGMKVLFDLVLNHSSIEHPYAQDRIAFGENSHYYDFYHTRFDGAKYSSHYNSDEYGFINYFWKHLVNLNFDNEEVQRWMLEACKYWVREYGIDGYRFDAIWGVMARKPEFGQRLRDELKSLQPDLLMLAEAKGGEADVYEKGFDAAYDWTSDTLWVSQWSWEYEYSESESKTVFNHPETEKRTALLKKALFANPDHQHRILRFTENNDLPRFPKHHGWDQSKLASSLVFSIAGIPMLYQGQETGRLAHPYTSKAIYDSRFSLSGQDSLGLLPFYKNIISKRQNNPVLSQGDMIPIDLPNHPQLLAFWRKLREEKVMVILNPGEDQQQVLLKDLPIQPARGSGLPSFFDYLNENPIQIEEGPSGYFFTLDPFEINWIID